MKTNFEKKISIIIPVYNVEMYLQQCLDSVFKQTYQNLEIITVNDGSRDASLSILEEYRQKFPEKMVIIDQNNQGLSAARNRGLEMATGEYVMFIDSDDYISNEYVETLVCAAEQHQSDMVVCGYTRVTNAGEELETPTANYCSEGRRIPSYTAWNRIIRRSVIEQYGFRYQEGIICEDIPVTLKLEHVSNGIEILKEKGYYYRVNPASITSTFAKKKLTIQQLPFQAIEESIVFCREQKGNITQEQMEFFLCRIWTTLLFDFGRKCDSRLKKEMCQSVEAIMKKYYPNYFKNPYVRPNAMKELPAVHRWGTWLFVLAMHLHVLYPFAWLCSKL